MWTARTSQPPHKCLKWTPRRIHAQEEAMPLVEWALIPMGHCNPKEEYANVIASTNHLEILCFVTGPPLARLPKPTKSCSDFLYEAECSMYTFRALMGESSQVTFIYIVLLTIQIVTKHCTISKCRDSWLPVGGESAESAMTWALNRVESTLST